jgi:WD40 repeat protein
VTNIADFAKDLLNEMRFGQSEDGGDLHIGRAPTIFVVHSMGGLVVKKAYLLGQNDRVYDDIISSISAMVFLGTPHRGSGLAETLNRILMASFNSMKGFIADLKMHSPALEDLNESFRHVAERLDIWSFYETRTTKLAGRNVMIVEKDSAILGYPKEISVPLDADHRNVCKFSSTESGNYMSVRNALRSLVGKFAVAGINKFRTRELQELKDIERLLGVSHDDEDDFETVHRQRAPGTCGWLLEESSVKAWLTWTPGSHILWYSAPPGSGKSVMAAFMIQHLRDRGIEPQYFFFQYGDQKKRTLSHCLQCIALQAARYDTRFRDQLHSLADEGLVLAKAGPKLIWQKLFVSSLFRTEFAKPLIWVIDGLDESDSPSMLLELLQALRQTQTCVRLLVISRKTQVLTSGFDVLSNMVQVSRIESSGQVHNAYDIVTIVNRDLGRMSGSEIFQSVAKRSIIERAQGNILWVRLVLQEVLACHTEEEVRRTLNDIPDDMTSFYQRIETAMINGPGKANTVVARSLLQWAVCSRRPLKLEELRGALPNILDLRRTINDVCSPLLAVDATGTVGLIHQTAREYLTSSSASGLHIDRSYAHGELCLATLEALSRPELRLKVTEQPHMLLDKNGSFITYAATSWAYHLRESSNSDKLIDEAAKFLRSTAVLTWIHVLALLGQLDVLVRAAKDLNFNAAKIKTAQASKNPLLQKLGEVELLERWSIDLTKIVAKFRKPLLEAPTTIYNVIPAICPALSITCELFNDSDSLEVAISGIPSVAWNDNLVRLVIPGADRGAQIISAGSHLAVLGTSGTTHVWDSRNFQAKYILQHEEPVTAICFSRRGDSLATYGLKSTKCWSLMSGKMVSCTTNEADVKALALAYTQDDKTLLVTADDKIVRSLDLGHSSSDWQVLCDGPAHQDSIEGMPVNSPYCARFNGDQTQVGLSYRGFPLTVWSLSDNRCIGRSKRSKAFRRGLGRASSTAWFAVDRFTFNPVTGHVIGVYRDGCVFKWHPLTGENQEVQSYADEVAASPDGKLFITTDTDGSIAVWSFAFMTKIYQLSSNDLVHGLAFSSDAQRFYDIRGRSVNAWEPNALVRFAEREASQTNAASEEQTSDVTHISEAYLESFEPITAMAITSDNTTFCFGDEDGAVYAYDVDHERKTKLMDFMNYQCITHLVLSTRGNCVVAADLSGDVMIKPLRFQSSAQPKAHPDTSRLKHPKFDLQGHGIDHMLINRLGSLLLVASNESAQLWSIDQNTIVARATLAFGFHNKLIQHPTNDDLFLAFGPYNVDVFHWNTLRKEASASIRKSGLDASNSESLLQMPASKAYVTKALSAEDGLHVLIHIKEFDNGVARKRLLIFDSGSFDGLTAGFNMTPHCHHLTEDIHRSVDIPLGVLRKDRGFELVFLDYDLWLCTLELDGVHGHGAVKRRYFVPRDWATTETFELAHVLSDGTLLSPKDAGVAIITYSGSL